MIAPNAMEAVLYDAMGTLPHFNPDDDPDGGPIDPAVSDLRARIGAADALLFSTPEYARSATGRVQESSRLDRRRWRDLRHAGGLGEHGRPGAPTGAADAHASLRKVLGYTGSEIVEEACARIPVSRAAIDAAGGPVVMPTLAG